MEEDSEAQKEWTKCATASHDLGQRLLLITNGPREGLIATMMLYISLCAACGIKEREAMLMLRNLWKVHEAVEQEQMH